MATNKDLDKLLEAAGLNKSEKKTVKDILGTKAKKSGFGSTQPFNGPQGTPRGSGAVSAGQRLPVAGGIPKESGIKTVAGNMARGFDSTFGSDTEGIVEGLGIQANQAAQGIDRTFGTTIGVDPVTPTTPASTLKGTNPLAPTTPLQQQSLQPGANPLAPTGAAGGQDIPELDQVSESPAIEKIKAKIAEDPSKFKPDFLQAFQRMLANQAAGKQQQTVTPGRLQSIGNGQFVASAPITQGGSDGKAAGAAAFHNTLANQKDAFNKARDTPKKNHFSTISTKGGTVTTDLRDGTRVKTKFENIPNSSKPIIRSQDFTDDDGKKSKRLVEVKPGGGGNASFRVIEQDEKQAAYEAALALGKKLNKPKAWYENLWNKLGIGEDEATGSSVGFTPAAGGDTSAKTFVNQSL